MLPRRPVNGVALGTQVHLVGLYLSMFSCHGIDELVHGWDGVEVWVGGWKRVRHSSLEELWESVVDVWRDGERSVHVDLRCGPVNDGVGSFVDEGIVS